MKRRKEGAGQFLLPSPVAFEAGSPEMQGLPGPLYPVS